MQAAGVEFCPLYARRGDEPSIQAKFARYFPTNPSLKWFYLRHKAELVEAGALVLIRGAWHGDPAKWVQLLPELLRADARAALTRPRGRPNSTEDPVD